MARLEGLGTGEAEAYRVVWEERCQGLEPLGLQGTDSLRVKSCWGPAWWALSCWSPGPAGPVSPVRPAEEVAPGFLAKMA